MKLDRNTLILVAVAAVILILLFVINMDFSEPVNMSVQVVNVDEPKKEDIVTIEGPASSFMVLVPGASVCEGCHMSGKPFIPQASSVEPHVNGGKYCLNCHKITHEIHPVNDNVTCEKCHGTVAGIPSYINGYISCMSCHDYPEPLSPSDGDIITIHKPRGITCNTCHTNTCTKCHTEEGTSERWEKRLIHFRTVSSMK